MKKFKVKISALVLVVVLLLSTVSVFAVSVPVDKYKYDEIIFEKLYPSSYNDPYSTIPDLYFSYRERYEYFSPENTSEIPDYVLVYLSENQYGEAYTADLFGDYVMYSNCWQSPFKYGYGIFIPETEEIICLTTAYKKGIDGIENVFTEAGIGRLVGDMDKDRKITIKDATYIQKALAEIIEFESDDWLMAFAYSENPPLKYISDFNRDGNRNINDVTAIQKHIARIVE